MYVVAAPDAAFRNPFGQGSFGPEILDEYLATYRDPVRVHGICEEYRAAAPAAIDVQHDRADKQAGRKIECPMLHLWAEGVWLDTYYAKDGGPLGIWRQWAPKVQGQAIKGGHFFPEENPDDTVVPLKQFLAAEEPHAQAERRRDDSVAAYHTILNTREKRGTAWPAILANA